MQNFLHHPIRVCVVFTLVPLLWLLSCDRPSGEDESAFLVNLKQENSTFSLTPGGGEKVLYVECDAEWTYRFQAPAAWLTVRDRKVNDHSWMLTLSAGEFIGEQARSAVLVFTSGNRVREVTVSQEPEDPLLQVLVPGAYGVEGGDEAYTRTRAQISRLTDGDSYVFSLLYPEEVKVVSISLPTSLAEGNSVTVGYKVVEKDRTLVKTDYFSVKVLRIAEPYVWLKADRGVFFVVRR